MGVDLLFRNLHIGPDRLAYGMAKVQEKINLTSSRTRLTAFPYSGPAPSCEHERVVLSPRFRKGIVRKIEQYEEAGAR